ncbi:MAG: hypothetical protein OXI38_08050, partial [Bacteroidota bacterium]|nr:hypothetical protein [Bacteroidota bacterium]
AHFNGVEGVASSNLAVPTKGIYCLRQDRLCLNGRGIIVSLEAPGLMRALAAYDSRVHPRPGRYRGGCADTTGSVEKKFATSLFLPIVMCCFTTLYSVPLIKYFNYTYGGSSCRIVVTGPQSQDGGST